MIHPIYFKGPHWDGRLCSSKEVGFPPLLYPQQKAASSDTEVHLAEVCVAQQITPLAPGYQFTEFYKLEIIWHVGFCSDLLFMAPRPLQKEGACVALCEPCHSIQQDWGKWDVCVVPVNHSHGTGAAADDGC